MGAPQSDALVFFGATGDLAHKKVFPALQAMVKHGQLDVPVIGVAKAGWDLDRLKARARDGLEQHGGVDEAAFTKLCGSGEEMAGMPVELLASHHADADEMDAYERLLGEAMKGDAALFAREDCVEGEWRIVEPVLGSATPMHEYEPNTWGPSQADWIITDAGGWHDPVMP